MKKVIFLCASIATLFLNTPISAQSSDINQIETEISDLTTTLLEKKAELRELKASQEGVYILETINATFAFSNPRIYENLLLIDVDYTNDSKGALEVMTDLWMLTFFQEDETSINPLWFENFNLPEVEGRRPLNYQLKIKSGATIALVIGLSKQTPYYPFEGDMGMANDNMMMETTEGQLPNEEELAEESSPETIEPFDDLSTLYIRVDAYASPSGRTEEIAIPIE